MNPRMSRHAAPGGVRFARSQPIGWAGDAGPVWRVRRGLVLLEHEVGSRLLPAQLAAPGDLLGAERLCGLPYACHFSALTQAEIEPFAAYDADARGRALADAVAQQQRQAFDMLRLRSGSVRERLRVLLSLVAEACNGPDAADLRKALPTQREIARLIDVAHETVCREIKGLIPGRIAMPQLADCADKPHSACQPA